MTNVFYVHQDSQRKLISMLAVYVDDIIISGSDQAIVKAKQEISQVFKTVDLGTVKIILGIQVKRTTNGDCILNQKRPDIAFSVSLLAWFSANPNPNHVMLAKRILSLIYYTGKPFLVTCYSDVIRVVIESNEKAQVDFSLLCAHHQYYGKQLNSEWLLEALWKQN
ncbi:hypothetical protein HMI54_005451 [Coelomomyces lativittatus]|nr:hypothetical protein HMI54_005451 [Coelomomyces lativittatus]